MGRVSRVLDTARPRRIAELVALDEAIRSPLPLSTRVGFVGVGGGVGCSVAAGLAASVLAARRPGRVLAVNASDRHRSLLWHAGLTSDAHVDRGGDADRAGARRADDVTSGLAHTPVGLACIDLVGPDPGGADSRWWEVVAPISRFFDFVVTDWGVRDAASDEDVTTSSALACVVAPADRTGLQRGLDLAETLREAGTPAVMAVTDPRRRRTAAVAQMIDLLPVPAVEIPYDPAHGAAAPSPTTGLRPRTTVAGVRLAAALVRAITGTGSRT